MYRLNDDRGAAAVVVVIAGAALLGMASFAIDTAAIYEERAELQNGADAAALAIAEDCLRQPVTCTYPTASTTADSYADLNAEDGAALVDGMSLDAIGQMVVVDVRTEDLEGGTVLAPFFGRVLGFDGASVAAEASAVWGYAGEMSTLPLVISDCEWLDPLRPELQEGPPFTGDPWLFVFHQGNHGRTCDHSNSGFDLPGGFGWLQTGDEECRALLTTGEWSPNVDPGSSPSNGCTPEYVSNLLLSGEPIFLPYYEDKAGGGSTGQYLVSSFGAFYVTGYNFGGQFKEPQGNVPCSGSTRCIAGYFVNATTSAGDPGGPDRGASIVKLIP